MCLVQTLESRNNKRLVRHIRHTEVFLQVYGCIFPRSVCRKHLSFIRAVRNKRDFRLLNNESLCSGRVGLRLSDCPSLDCNAALRLLWAWLYCRVHCNPQHSVLCILTYGRIWDIPLPLPGWFWIVDLAHLLCSQTSELKLLIFNERWSETGFMQLYAISQSINQSIHFMYEKRCVYY